MGKKLIVLLVVVGLFALIGALAARPAAFIGVHSGALAHSVGDGGDAMGKGCVEEGDDLWLCQVAQGASGSSNYAVITRRFGCWDAWGGSAETKRILEAARIDKGPAPPNDPDRSGCINVLDFAFGG